MDFAQLSLWTGLAVALGAGALSFLSPCVLPIFPAYLSYITGVSIKELEGTKTTTIRKKLLFHSIAFLLGVSLVFFSLGVGATFVGHWLKQLLNGPTGVFIQQIAGIFIIIMGLFIAGWIKLPWLMQDTRKQGKRKQLGYVGTFFVGLGFAAGWTPCIGPIFAAILLLASAQPNMGLLYVIAYIVGFALPFLIFTFFIGSIRSITKYSGIIMKIGGMMIIIMGLLLFTGELTRITSFLLDLVEGTWLSNLG